MSNSPTPIPPYETLVRLHRSCQIARDDVRLAFHLPGLPPTVRLAVNEAYASILDALQHTEMAVNLLALDDREVPR